MIFKQWEQIIGLEQPPKNETRRGVKDNEGCTYAPDGSISEVGYIPLGGGNWRRKWYIGQRLPLMTGRGKPAVWRCRMDRGSVWQYSIAPGKGCGVWARCYITVTSLAREPIQDITETGAIREGVKDVARYQVLFESINGAGSWAANGDVWVMGFEYEE